MAIRLDPTVAMISVCSEPEFNVKCNCFKYFKFLMIDTASFGVSSQELTKSSSNNDKLDTSFDMFIVSSDMLIVFARTWF